MKKPLLEIMTPNPKMIQSGDSLQDVVKLFIEQGISSSPVINPLGEVLGFLTELGLVKAYTLHKTKFQKNNKVGHHIELLEPVTFVDQGVTLSELFREIIAAPTHRLLVTDDKKKILGIVTLKDLMRAMHGPGIPSQDIKDKLIEVEAKLKISMQELGNLERQLEMYQTAFHETPYLMHAVDKNGVILMANKREHDFLGYPDGELVGKTIFDIYAASMHAEAKRGLQQVIKHGVHPVTYTTLERKDGRTSRCDIASSAIHDHNGNFVSTISVLRPVDSEELLRALHGIVSEQSGPLSRYISVKKDES